MEFFILLITAFLSVIFTYLFISVISGKSIKDSFFRAKSAFFNNISYKEYMEREERGVFLHLKHLLIKKKFEEAEIKIEKAIAQYPSNLNLVVLQAENYIQLKKYSEAISVLKKAKKISQKDNNKINSMKQLDLMLSLCYGLDEDYSNMDSSINSFLIDNPSFDKNIYSKFEHKFFNLTEK